MMSITRIAPERCSIACSPGSEQGRRSRSRGRSTTAFAPDWTSGRRFGLLDEARAPKGGRPTLRAGIVLTLPRWTRCRLRRSPAVRASLDLTTMPARCPGRRGHAPHESASPLAGFCTLGRSAIRGSPQAAHRPGWGRAREAGLRAGRPCPTPRGAWCGAPTSPAWGRCLRDCVLRGRHNGVAHKCSRNTALYCQPTVTK